MNQREQRQWWATIAAKDVAVARAEKAEASVAELESAIAGHRDRFIFANPDFEDYELWKTLDPKP